MFLKFCNDRYASGLHDVDSDVDYANHRGKDISKKEFIENEVFIDLL